MLIPRNPHEFPLLWDAIQVQLTQGEMLVLIENSRPITPAKILTPSPAIATQWAESFKKKDFVRFTQNRGMSISPHFAGDINQDHLSITDLIISPIDGGWEDTESIHNIIEIVVTSVIYSKFGPSKIFIPCPVSAWQNEWMKMDRLENGLMFTKP